MKRWTYKLMTGKQLRQAISDDIIIIGQLGDFGVWLAIALVFWNIDI